MTDHYPKGIQNFLDRASKHGEVVEVNYDPAGGITNTGHLYVQIRLPDGTLVFNSGTGRLVDDGRRWEWITRLSGPSAASDSPAPTGPDEPPPSISPNNLERARRAVGSKRWRWLVGCPVVKADGTSFGPSKDPEIASRWAIVDILPDGLAVIGFRIATHPKTGERSWAPVFVPPEQILPDMTDPNIGGYLLTVLRMAHHDENNLWNGRVEIHQDHHRLYRVVQPYHTDEGGLDYHFLAGGFTENDALVNALVAAP